jgi:predicted acylesterase/phospholipase RssA
MDKKYIFEKMGNFPKIKPSRMKLNEKLVRRDKTNPNWKPNALVVGYGGIKGFILLGSLLYLEKEGYLNNIKKFAGVSVGAIICLLLVVGYKVSEIIEKVIDANIFRDISSIDLSKIKENDGIISNKYIQDFLSKLVEDKVGVIPTLHQLYMYTGIKFVSVSLNLDKDCIEYISYETEPSLSCIHAILLSMNIPFLFYKLKYKDCLYIDGAFGNPYPIDIFDDNQTDVLGIYINSIEDSQNTNDSTRIKYLSKTLDASIVQIRKRIISDSSDRCVHFKLNTNYLGDPIGLTSTTQIRRDMILSGYHQTEKIISEMKGKTKKRIILKGEANSSMFSFNSNRDNSDNDDSSNEDVTDNDSSNDNDSSEEETISDDKSSNDDSDDDSNNENISDDGISNDESDDSSSEEKSSFKSKKFSRLGTREAFKQKKGIPRQENRGREIPRQENRGKEIPKHENRGREIPRHENKEKEIPKHENKEREIPKQENKEKEILKHENKEREIPKHENKEREIPKHENKEREIPKQESKEREIPKHENKEREIPKHENKEREIPKHENKEKEISKQESKEKEDEENENTQKGKRKKKRKQKSLK